MSAAKDRVVVVTGGGRGIGRAICVRFASSGALVVAASRDVASLEETKSQIELGGGRCDIHPLDVSDEAAVKGLMEMAASLHGRIDVLCNNAGVAPLGTIADMEPSRFDELLAVNIRGVYLGCRAVWPIMRAGGGGVIINTSSVASVDPFPGFAAYGASKAWVNAWTHGLAEEGKALGIRVFAVAPGAVETRMLRDAVPDFPAEQALDPAAVADMAYVLSQPECAHASGQTIYLRK